MHCELVKTITDDDLILNGLFAELNKDEPVILYIHGFEADFYSHKFIASIAETLRLEGMSFLSVQTRGTSSRQELISSDGEGKYNGSFLELLEEASLDIDAWVSFLNERGFENIILAGHSLGTLKIVRYLSEGRQSSKITKLLLLCPFDKNGMENLVTEGAWKDYVLKAESKISQGKGEKKIPDHWEEVSMSYQTFYSWYIENDFNKMFDFYDQTYFFPILNNIEIPVHTIVGTEDEFFHPSNPEHPEEAMELLLNNLKYGSGKLIDGANHTFIGFENELAEEVLKFVSI
jgi:predicted alpha/beta-fold hydrolase